ncbi:MAG: hypothetical protein M3165_09290, partial [Actinomycetota bacterium]|nr:hypothetical protein [Actinomycetota bacterium]
MGLLLAVMLAVLALVALVSLAVTFMSLVAAVLMPLLAGTVRRIRRWMWRDWHPPTDWLPDAAAPRPEPARSPAVALVSSHARDADVRLLATQPSSHGEHADPTLTTVHARLAPAGTLDLPPDARCPMVVCVLSGHGTVGPDHRRVGPGELAVLGAGTPITVAADPADGAEGHAAADRPAMEVLVAQMPAPEHRDHARQPREHPARALRRRPWPAPLRPLGAAVAA